MTPLRARVALVSKCAVVCRRPSWSHPAGRGDMTMNVTMTTAGPRWSRPAGSDDVTCIGSAQPRCIARSMYGDQWTADLVIQRLVVAFRRMPSTPIYSPIKNRLEPAFWQLPVDGADLIMASTHYLGRKSRARLQLLAYARARARGIAVTQLCREEGWPRATLYRRVRAAAEAVAQGLNRDRRPPQAVA
jgi:hypothetical protein